MALSTKSILAHIDNWRGTLENREVDASTVLDSIESVIRGGEETTEPAATQIIVTGYGTFAPHSAKYDNADDWFISAEGALEIYKGKTPIANHAAGTWASVRIAES